METVYLVYENQYENELPESIEVYTKKGLIEHAEDVRRGFIELEDHKTPIENFEEALYFLEVLAECTIIEKCLLQGY